MTDATHGELAAPGARSILRHLLRADATVLVKNVRSLVLSILLPIVLLLTTNHPRAEFRLGGSLLIVGLCVTYGLMSTSLLGYANTVARDRERGVFQRLRVTPAPSWTIMSSRLAVQMVANLLIALVVLIVGVRIHHLDVSFSQYLLTLAVSVLGGAMFLGIGQTLVGLVRSADAVNAAGRLLYISLIFLGLLGLEGILGSTFQSIAKWSPVGVLMTAYAGVLHTAAWTTTDTLAVVSCVGYLIAGTAAGIVWFRWDPR
ncbi:MAG TPA: ABC transporter permease [Mycobacteriales bacterium]|nr:ABC transporter permease [Mycobacteriales bacterium]